MGASNGPAGRDRVIRKNGVADPFGKLPGFFVQMFLRDVLSVALIPA
jgi:hypothetical protein